MKRKQFSIKKRIYFEHDEGKMKNEGDVLSARKYFFNNKNKNLYHLLKNRFHWMNKFIDESDNILEIGSGAALLKDFINNKNFKTSDLSDYDFLDFKNIDAMNTGFRDEEFSKVISSNMIHHTAYPLKHLREMLRILKPGGYYIIQDVNCSILLQLLQITMKLEGFDFTVDLLDENKPCNDPLDLWSGNSALPNLIFDDFEKINKELDYKFKKIYSSYGECLSLMNSGGVTAKTFYIPLNDFFNKIVKNIDALLILMPRIFALQQSIVIQKIK